MREKLRLCVLFGGRSTEYEVSLMSAHSILSHLDEQKYEIVKIGITKEGNWKLFEGDLRQILDNTWEHSAPCRVAILPNGRGELAVFKEYTYEILPLDAAFPVLHGLNGEDGSIQGLLQLADLPYVGCGIAASANCMDKVIASTLFNHYGIPHCKWDWTWSEDFEADVQGTLTRMEQIAPYPLFVKPSRSGSSVGVKKASNRKELEENLRYAAQFDKKLVVEECISGREIETAVLGNRSPEAACCGEILPSSEFYDYNAKYIDGKSGLLIPAPLEEETSGKIRELAVQAYKALDCRGLARVDFFLRYSDGQPVVNEINTLPGFTGISMYPQLQLHSGFTYPELLDRLIELALEEA